MANNFPMRFPHLLFLSEMLSCAFQLRSQSPCRMNYQAPPELLRAFPAVAPATANFIIPTVVPIYYDSTSTAPTLPSYQDILAMISAMNVRLQKQNDDTITICNLYRRFVFAGLTVPEHQSLPEYPHQCPTVDCSGICLLPQHLQRIQPTYNERRHSFCFCGLDLQFVALHT
jgi:hypothetical protein